MDEKSVEMKFEIGDRVVHPQHGVGHITGVEEKQFEPKVLRTYYVISIPDTTLWVPVDLPDSALRKLSDIEDIEQCRKVLLATPFALKADRGLMSSLAVQIKQGTVFAHCEVVRDLTAFGWRKPIFGPLADYQRMLLEVLGQEWAIVSGISEAAALHEIDVLLRKCRSLHEQ